MNINSAPPSSPPPLPPLELHLTPPETFASPSPSGTTTYASKSGPDRNKLDLSFHTFPFYSRDSSRAIVGLDPQFLLLSGFVENTVFFTRQSAHIVVICNILAATVFLSTEREIHFSCEETRCEADISYKFHDYYILIHIFLIMQRIIICWYVLKICLFRQKYFRNNIYILFDKFEINYYILGISHDTFSF